MKLQEFQIGTKIEIEVADDGSGEGNRNILISQFEAIKSDKEAVIDIPFFKGNIYQIHPGSIIIVYINKGSELYKFRASVLERRLMDGSIPVLDIEKVDEIQRIQRRGFFRFDCVLKAKYRIFKGGNNQFIDSYTKDISGGGIRILLKEEVDESTILEFELYLDESSTIKFTGTVQRVFDRKNDEKYKFEAGILFENIENKERENIIKFVFNEQRKLIKKGLI